MKRLIIILLTALLICRPVLALASGVSPIDLSKASGAVLLDTNSGKTIVEKNADEPVEFAGLKRLPALLAVCEAFDAGKLNGDTEIRVSSEAAAIRGTTAFLSANERIGEEPLLKAAVMLTAGDAIYALLTTAYPGEAASLENVNRRLSELGASVVLEKSMGEGALLSVSDVVKLARALSRSSAFLKYSSVYIDSITHENGSTTELTNPNRLVRFYSGCFGLATGSVGASEYSGAFIARRGTTTFIAVIAGAPDSTTRFKLATDLLDYGFASYRSVEINGAGEEVGLVPVTGGKAREVTALTGESVTALMPTSDTRITTEAVLPEMLEAPVAQGDEIGRLIIKNAAGETVGEARLVAGTAVDEARYGDYFMDIIRSWLRRSNN